MPQTFMILTRGDGAATWNTLEPENGVRKYPDGNYQLTVKATEFSGVGDEYSVNVRVDNDPD
jgi:hypothetical protein